MYRESKFGYTTDYYFDGPWGQYAKKTQNDYKIYIEKCK